MITALVRSDAGAYALGRTLSTLVPGVVEGLLSHVCVLKVAPDGEVDRVISASGADSLTAQGWTEAFRQAAGSVTSRLILGIDAGVLPGESFWPVLADAIRSGLDENVLLTRAGDAGLMSAVLARMTGRVTLDQVIVLPKVLCDGLPWDSAARGRRHLMAVRSIRLRLSR